MSSDGKSSASKDCRESHLDRRTVLGIGAMAALGQSAFQEAAPAAADASPEAPPRLKPPVEFNELDPGAATMLEGQVDQTQR